MSETHACPECGAAPPADSPRGLCPKCLMGAAFGEAEAHRPAEPAGPGPGRPTVDAEGVRRADPEIGAVAAEEPE